MRGEKIAIGNNKEIRRHQRIRDEIHAIREAAEERLGLSALDISIQKGKGENIVVLGQVLPEVQVPLAVINKEGQSFRLSGLESDKERLVKLSVKSLKSRLGHLDVG